MKKKKIKLLSSLLGVSAFCGLFALSCTNTSTSQVKAVDEYVNRNVTLYYDSVSKVVPQSVIENLISLCDDEIEYTSTIDPPWNTEITYITPFEDGREKSFKVGLYYNATFFDTITISVAYNIDASNQYWDVPSFEMFIILEKLQGNYDREELYYTPVTIDSQGAWITGDVLCYANSPLEIVTGDDINNPILTSFLGYLGYISGVNTYELNVLTIEQLQAQIEDLQGVVSSQQETIEYWTNRYGYAYEQGYAEGKNSVLNRLNEEYLRGYNEGYYEGFNTDETLGTVFSSILQVGLLPINFFLACFNFEILGVNLADFITAMITFACVIFVVRMILGNSA